MAQRTEPNFQFFSALRDDFFGKKIAQRAPLQFQKKSVENTLTR